MLVYGFFGDKGNIIELLFDFLVGIFYVIE